MPNVQRSSDVVEGFAEKALMAGIGGLVSLGLGALFVYYRGMLTILGYLLLAFGAGLVAYAVYEAVRIRKVRHVSAECPFCRGKNVLTEAPQKDFTCRLCHRLIPVVEGRFLKVFQVRCGFCNELNFYSEKSVGLICESCDRVIPIATGDGEAPVKAFATYARQDDDRPYDLILIANGAKTEELVACLQQMLALNRNQVKQMLMELPVTLLSGIPKRKAEMLAAQITLHDGAADVRETVSV